MLVMARKKEKRPRAGKNINAWLPSELVDAFHRSRDDDRRGVAQQLEVLLTEALKARGYWPPKPDPESD